MRIQVDPDSQHCCYRIGLIHSGSDAACNPTRSSGSTQQQRALPRIFSFYLGVFQRGVATHKGGAAGRAADKDVAIEGDIHEDPLRLQVHHHHVLDTVQAVHLPHMPEHGQCVLIKKEKKVLNNIDI